MGSVVRKITRPIKKLIPKEVKPFLPYAAAAFGAPYLAGSGLGSLATFATKNPALTKALIAGTTAGVTDDNANILRTAALAAAPDVISGGLGKVSQAGNIPVGPQPQGSLSGILKAGQQIAQSGSEVLKPTTFLGKTKLLGAQASVDQAAKFAEINQDEIDKYNEELRKRGVMDKTKRRTSIFNIYQNAGYDDDYINSMLDRYGYAGGGVTTPKRGLVNQAGSYSGRRNIPGATEAMTEFYEDLDDKVSRGKNDKRRPRKSYKGDDDDDNGGGNITSGLAAAADGVERAFGRSFGNEKPVPMLRFAQGGRIGLASGGNFESYKDFIESTGDDELMDLYIEFLGTKDFTKLGNALKRKGYATGGEVEIEEETDDLGIMDFMRDQGIEYGEQASYGFDDAMSDSFDRFQDYRKRGLIPLDMEFDEFLEIMRDSKKSKDGIMQMASGYKDDLEEMYEQYVFQMEEQGLQPMSFSDFLRQAQSGMAKGGSVNSKPKDQMKEIEGQTAGPQWYQDRLEHLMSLGYSYEEAGNIAYDSDAYYNVVGGMASGGRVNYAGGGIMMASHEGNTQLLEQLYEDFLDMGFSPKDAAKKAQEAFDDMTMKQKPNRTMAQEGGRVNYAGGGASYNSSARYSFLINKQNQGILSPDEQQELLMLEMTYADESQGKADGGIMNKNLLNTGMDKDMRGGGFIPEGTKEKADDVPARLSKNEFVMTADAVRAAGGGSVNKGAKRMYDMMYQLEGKV